jgi:hypothetical protein
MYLPSKELVSAPAKTGKWSKLAEAIRKGCKLRPVQCFGSFTEGRDSACALYAARLGGGSFPRHPILKEIGGCPVCREGSYDNVLPHLNDIHRMTREKIADFLDTL